jgi:NADH:ubiquinone oxidoreductase subunit 6 (subunit J)
MVVAAVLLMGLILSVVHSHFEPGTIVVENSVADIGHSLLGEFLGPFELASVLLLVALLGAAYLARPKAPTQGAQQRKGTTV